MARLRLFGSAREAAGVAVASIGGGTVSEVLEAAGARFGTTFAGIVAISKIWVDGEPAGVEAPVGEEDEVAVLPPVSGGSA
jgi:molybdopterin converting factor small subunit